MDHAPGPIIANVAPNVANRIGIPRWALEYATHASARAITVPQAAVQRAKRSNAPAAAPMRWEAITPACDGSLRCQSPEQHRTEAVITRCRSRPLPGQLFGNVEKRRCKSPVPA